jgi:NitT/TauT family transport system substrate-binding protein
MHRIVSALTLAGLAGLLALGVLQGAAQDLPVINVAFHPNLHGAPVVALGEAKGYFKAAGLGVKSHRFTFGPPEISAMAAGKLDIGFLGPGAMFFVMQGRATLIAVDAIGFTDEILAAADSGVTTLAGMKGKKVLTVEGTSGEMALRLGLRKAGLTMSDVEVINASPENALSAFMAGRAPLLALWQPMTNQVKKAQPATRVLSNDRDFYPEFVFPGVWIANNDFVQKRPDLVKRFLAAQKRAIDFRARHMAETIPIVSTFTEVPADILQSQAEAARWLTAAELETAFRDGSADRWFTRLGEMFVEMGRLKENPKVDAYFRKDLFLDAR